MKFLTKALFPLLLFFIAACGPKQDTDTPVYREITDLYGKKVAATTGSSQESILAARHPQIEILRFETDADLLNALLAGKCDAMAVDQHIFKYFSQITEGAVELQEPMFSIGIGFCFEIK